METNNQLWHQLRSENVGGSEVADLFGCGFNSHFHLWHVKAGNIEPPDLSSDEWVMSGNFLEAGIIAWAEWKFGLKFYNPKAYYKHETIKGMACTPDGISVHDMNQMCQIKNIDSIIFGREWECDGDIITNAPLKYLLQCQHEIACANAESSELLVLVGGKSLKRMTVIRDDDVIRIIEDAVEKFWRSIEIGDEPEPDYKVDGPVIQELRKREPIAQEPIDWSDNNRMREVALGYLDANQREKEAKEDKDRYKAEIMLEAIGGKKFLFGEQTGDPRITIVDKTNSSYPLVTQVK